MPTDVEPEQPTARSIWLWPDGAPEPDAHNGFRPWLDPCPIDAREPRGAVLICPGGGYGRRARHEGVVMAEAFNGAGIPAFVVHYRVAPNRHPSPLRDAAQAMRMVRDRADEWLVKPDRLAIMGFSAGGHLACSLGVHYDKPDANAGARLDAVSCRPDALILCYPVITAGEFAHRGSIQNLLGKDAPERMLDMMSLERHVNAQTPPTFLWHTASDPGVPVQNSLFFADALKRSRVAFELHVYPEGKHGLGLAPDLPHVATWFGLCCEWLRGMGW